MTRILLIAAAVLLGATPGYAQIENCGTYRETIESLVTGKDVVTGEATNVPLAAARLSSVQNNVYCFALYVAEPAGLDALVFQQFVKQFEGSRTDKESSAGSTSGGTTAVVAQGPAAKILSAAVEYGALTRAVDGQVITIRGNLAGLPSTLVGKDVFPYCPAGAAVSEFCVDGSVLSWLRRATVSVSFDASRGTQAVGAPDAPAGGAAQPVTFTATRSQISGFSSRLEVWNRRDVTSAWFQESWRNKVAAVMAQPASDLSLAAGALADIVLDVPGYDAWQKQTAMAIAGVAPDRDGMVATLRTALDQLIVLARAANPDLPRRASDALNAYSRFFLAQDDLIESLATKNVLAVEFAHSRPTGHAATNHWRAIVDLPLTTRTKLVANAALSFYQDLPEAAPAGMSRYRDAQVGVQLEHGLGRQSIVGPAVLTIAGYYQYQHAAALLEIDPANPLPGVAFTGLPDAATTVFTNTGDILLGQVKLSLAPGGSGIKIPLSLTLSNRTELIDKPTWRGQLGLTYDFDALLSALDLGR